MRTVSMASASSTVARRIVQGGAESGDTARCWGIGVATLAQPMGESVHAVANPAGLSGRRMAERVRYESTRYEVAWQGS